MLKEAFRVMDREVDRIRGKGPLAGFGKGPRMHEAARQVAPYWLQRWDDDNLWLICFTQGWEGLLIFNKAFKHSKEKLLLTLTHYANHLPDTTPVAPEPIQSNS